MVYLLSRRGTLHKVIQSEAGIQTFEADNIDSAQGTVYQALSDVDPRQIKRMCRRCFPV